MLSCLKEKAAKEVRTYIMAAVSGSTDSFAAVFDSCGALTN